MPSASREKIICSGSVTAMRYSPGSSPSNANAPSAFVVTAASGAPDASTSVTSAPETPASFAERRPLLSSSCQTSPRTLAARMA